MVDIKLISLTVCLISIEQTWGNSLSTASSVRTDTKNIALGENMRIVSAKQESKVDPRDNLSMDKINFVIYAGKIISTLNKDPKYEEMKDRFNDPSGQEQSLLNLMAMMSNKTCEELNQIKTETIQALKKNNRNPKKDVKPDYIDFDSPEKFNVIDLQLVTEKVVIMRSLIEDFFRDAPGSG